MALKRNTMAQQGKNSDLLNEDKLRPELENLAADILRRNRNVKKVKIEVNAKERPAAPRTAKRRQGLPMTAQERERKPGAGEAAGRDRHRAA